MTCALTAYFTAHTAIYVPYGASGVELTRGLRERNLRFTYRHLAYTLALVAGIGVVAVFTRTEVPRTVSALLGVGGAAAVLLTVLPFCVFVTEPTAELAPARRSFAAMARAVLDDDQARRLFAIVFVQRAGAAAASAPARSSRRC